jgi:hypothetical protein
MLLWFHRSSASTPARLELSSSTWGLVLERQFATLERAPEMQLQLEPLRGRRPHLFGEALEIVFPVILGMIHSQCGLALQHLRLAAVLRVETQADARADE